MAEQTEITRYQGNSIIRSYDDAERAAKAMATSGYFADAKQAGQAVVKILAGLEMGFGPFASMNGVYIIQGRPSIGANLMAAAVMKSGRYKYRVVEMTEKVCTVDFYEGKEKIGTSTFTEQDAKKAGTKNMDKYPRNMLFARAISNGIKWFCPDVFNGSTVYTPEELGATVNEDGEVIDVPFATTSPEPTTPPAVEHHPGIEHPPINKPVKPAKLTIDMVIDHMRELSQLPRNNVKATLAYCKLTPEQSTYEQYEEWWKQYKSARNQNMTPAESGSFANQLLGMEEAPAAKQHDPMEDDLFRADNGPDPD